MRGQEGHLKFEASLDRCCSFFFSVGYDEIL